MTIKLLILKSGEEIISDINEMAVGEEDDQKVIGYFLRRPCLVKMKNPGVIDQEKNKTKAGFEIFTVQGWDYPNLIHTFQKAGELARTHHVPVLIHVTELTQPQGHSTSGSHERYKSEDRLKWEKENDCNRKFRAWILDSKIATEAELNDIENQPNNKQSKQKMMLGKPV